MDVVALGGLLAHQGVEADVAATDLAVLDHLVLVVILVALSNSFGELDDYLIIIAGRYFGLLITVDGLGLSWLFSGRLLFFWVTHSTIFKLV